MRDGMRFHEISWGESNFSRQDFKWIGEPYLGNEKEYPLLQFQVTTGLGRVVGFFDEANTFCVVCFDPNHNVQRSKKSQGKKACEASHTPYDAMKIKVDRALGALSDGAPGSVEKARDHLARATIDSASFDDSHRVVVSLSEKDSQDLHEILIRNPGLTLRTVMEDVFLAYLNRADTIIATAAAPDGDQTIDDLDVTVPEPIPDEK